VVVDELFRALEDLKQRGTSLLLVEQHVTRAMEAADRVYVLNRGALAFEGTAGAAASPGVLETAYMGKAALRAAVTV
jgi:branched-chain amino acid transport system ATP-binding protein